MGRYYRWEDERGFGVSCEAGFVSFVGYLLLDAEQHGPRSGEESSWIVEKVDCYAGGKKHTPFLYSLYHCR